MSKEKYLKKKIEELKEKFPGVDTTSLEKDLIPMEGGELGIKTKKKKA